MTIKWILGFFLCILDYNFCRGQYGNWPSAGSSGLMDKNCYVKDTEGVCRKRHLCQVSLHESCDGAYAGMVCCRWPVIPKSMAHYFTRTTEEPNDRSWTCDIKEKRVITDFGDTDVLFPYCGFIEPDSHPIVDRYMRRGEQRTKRAVGGTESQPHAWPWMVVLYHITEEDDNFHCGASLISQNYVLTAAHCFDKIKRLHPQDFFVMLGAHHREKGKVYYLNRMLIHPDYNKGQYYNDICIMRTAKSVQLNAATFPVCLPSPSIYHLLDLSVQKVTVKGWGDTSHGGKSSVVLREVEMPFVPLKTCDAAYQTVAKKIFPHGINDLFICAGFKNGGIDACQGDSGGPMVMPLKDGSYVQIGIVSFGYGCAKPGYPGVYTRVSKYTKWIKENTDL